MESSRDLDIGRGTIDGMFALRQLVDKNLHGQKYMAVGWGSQRQR